MSKIKYKIEEWFYNVKYFFINIWKFRKSLANYRSWDSEYNLSLYIESIKDLRNNMETYSKEVKEDLNPKLVDMDRLIELFNNLKEDNYVKRSGYDSNYNILFKPHDEKGEWKEMVTDESKEQSKTNSQAIRDGHKLEDKEWKEMLELIGKSKTWWF